MKNNDIIIGVLGGMGTYATINVFKQYADLFIAEKEWERPRIIIDNRCTMPSRVRAFLYKENVDELVKQMGESLNNLYTSGCNRILLACNTSHLFLPQIYNKYPKLEDTVLSIVDNCVLSIKNEGVKKTYLLASEGTIDSKIYQNAFENYDIECVVPNADEYSNLRLCIEAVKQNKYDENVKKVFLDLVNRYDNCLLGCTELPILYEKYKEDITVKAYDPMKLALIKLKQEYDNK